MARAGGWERAVLHGHVPAHPTPQAAGTEHFSLGVGGVPAAGSRPDRLSAVSGPQERVQRRTVEQIVDCALVVPFLDVPVPQVVSGEVVKVLGQCFVGTWEPLPQAPVLEPEGGVHQDLAKLERARRRTGREVADAYPRWSLVG